MILMCPPSPLFLYASCLITELFRSRSDGQEVFVDDKDLKASNPLLVFPFDSTFVDVLVFPFDSTFADVGYHTKYISMFALSLCQLISYYEQHIRYGPPDCEVNDQKS